MTDERMGDVLWPALRRLAPGSGVVFRHHATPPGDRRALFARVRRIAVARRLVLVAAGSQRLCGRVATHGDGPGGSRPSTWPVHVRRDAVAGVVRGAATLFVSPVFATRSHPGARPIGAMHAARTGAGLGVRIVALGGMDAPRFRRIARHGFDGWAAIDALHPEALSPVLRDQKRKAVPR